MHIEADKDYYLKRARICRDQADRSQDVGVRAIHRDMVQRYVRAARDIGHDHKLMH